MNLNESGGYHKGDHNWKSPKDVAEILRQCAAGQGNLMLNLAPMGDGAIPEPWERCVEKVGAWLRNNREAIFTNRRFVSSLRTADGAESDYTQHGRFTASRNAFYWHIRNWPGNPLRLTGLEGIVDNVSELSSRRQFQFRQAGNWITVEVPEWMDTDMPVVLRFQTRNAPRIYNCGGYAIPSVKHCRYDPLPSELMELP